MININNLSLHFAAKYLYENISFKIVKKDRIGLVGKNGAGKSTLLKILSKEILPSNGSIYKEGVVTIGFLKQDLEFNNDKTLWNEVELAFVEIKALEDKINKINQELNERIDYETDSYLKLIEDLNDIQERFQLIGGYTYHAQIEQILIGLGFQKEDFTKSTALFSGGWRMRIELAKLLLQNNDVLLLDEPTNHLDIDSIVWLESFLKNYHGAVLLVSHDRQFLDEVTNRTIEIIGRKIYDYKLPYSKFMEQRAERIEQQASAAKNQEKEIKQTEQLIEKFRYKASKAAMAQSLIKKLDKMERIEVDELENAAMRIKFVSSVRPGKVVFELENVGKSFGEKQVFNNVDLMIERGETIAFVGQNGQGKSTLAKMMVSQLEGRGSIKIGHNVEVGYFAQNQSEILNPNHTVLEEAENAANEFTRLKVRDYLGAFLFSGEDVEKRVNVLSGGERNRLALCKLLLQPFNTLVMDEPTNHLDLQSKEILKSALKNFEGTLILISHDRDFLQGLTEKVFEFRNGKVKSHLGDINAYLENRKLEDFRQLEAEKQIVSKKTEVEKENKVDTKQSYADHKKYKKIQNQIANLESKISKLEKESEVIEYKMAAGEQSEEILNEYTQIQKKLEETMLAWEEKLTELEH